MPIVLTLIAALLGTAPILLVTHAAEPPILVALISALCLLIGALKIPSVELQRASVILRRVILIAAIPALWMLVQLLPLPFAWSHPIWTSASAALPALSFGHLTMSMADTMQALAIYIAYLVLCAATLLAVVDRRRAEFCLVALVLAVTALVVASIVIGIFYAPAVLVLRQATDFMAVLGCILSAALFEGSFERHRSKNGGQQDGKPPARLILIGSLISFAGCIVALQNAKPEEWISALLGLGAFFATVRLSRFGFSRATLPVLIAILLSTACFLTVRANSAPSKSVLIAMVSSVTPVSTSAVERMLKSVPFLGNGAGTFGAFAGIHQELGSPVSANAPSLAIKLVIEWGVFALPALLLCAVWLVGLLIRSSLMRGRDALFAAAAAGCVTATACQAVFDSSLLNPTVALVTTVTVGLGLGQAIGRSSSS